MSLLLWAFLLLFPLSNAAKICSEILTRSREPGPEEWTPRREPPLPKDIRVPWERETKEFLAIRGLIDQGLLKGFEHHPSPSLFLTKENNGYFDGTYPGGRLIIPYRETGEWLSPERPGWKDRKVDWNVFIHEYGHAVFKDNFGAWLSKKATHKEIKAAWELYREMQNELERYTLKQQDLLIHKKVMEGSPERFHPVEKTALQKQIDLNESGLNSARKELTELEKELNDLFRKYPSEYNLLGTQKRAESTWHRGYEELFSDLLVVLYDGNPSVMSETLKKYGASPQNRSSRDFAHINHILGWKDAEEHNLLAPTRTFIGKFYLPKFKGKEHELITHVWECITEELESGRWRRTPEQINLDLVNRLKKRIGYPN